MCYRDKIYIETIHPHHFEVFPEDGGTWCVCVSEYDRETGDYVDITEYPGIEGEGGEDALRSLEYDIEEERSEI